MIRTLLASAAAALLAAASPAAAQSAPATPAPLAAIPGVTIQWYDVTGTTREQIAKSKKGARPASPSDPSQRFDVLSTWRIDTSWATLGKAPNCAVTEPAAKFSAVVNLPRLVPAEGQDEKLLQSWSAFVDALATYEAQFLRYASDHSADVAAAVGASSCAKANDASNAGIATVAKAVSAMRAKTKPPKGAF